MGRQVRKGGGRCVKMCEKVREGSETWRAAVRVSGRVG